MHSPKYVEVPCCVPEPCAAWFVSNLRYIMSVLWLTLLRNWSCWTLQALSKTLTVDELFYLKEQFALFQPNKNGTIALENLRMVSMWIIQHFFSHMSGVILKGRKGSWATFLVFWIGIDETCHWCNERVSGAWAACFGNDSVLDCASFCSFSVPVLT